MTALHSGSTFSVVEARSKLGQLIRALHDDESSAIYIGSHRKPEAVLLSVKSFEALGFKQIETPKLLDLVDRASVLKRLASTYGVTALGVFGSVATGTAGPGSDIDIAVEVDSSADLISLAAFEDDLESILGSRVQLAILAGASKLREKIAEELIWL